MEARALGFLTFFIAIFTIGRFLVGVLLKRFVPAIVLALSSVIALAGCIILTFSSLEVITYLALSLAGFGLAAAFPVVLGTIGDRFAKWSGTAFGVALTIALLGNMFINYLTGIVTESYGMTSYAWMVIVSGLFTLLLIALSLRRFSER
jgi:fucose permease